MNAPTTFLRLRAEREAEWRRLDDLVTLCEKKSPRALSDEDLMALPILYRGALSSLSVARETSLDLELVNYLESLCARAYLFLYGVRTSPGARLRRFFARDWPDAMLALWKETLISLVILAVGTIAGYLLVQSEPEYYGAFVPEGLAGGRDFSADTEMLRSTLYDENAAQDALGVFATFLFTHNAQVAIKCFALGFAFAVPTVLMLLYHGAMVGAFFALFNSHDLGLELGGWLIIHGSTELFAIVLASAAGLRIGWSVVFPGAATRLEAAARSGKEAATAMVGVVIMLFAAGLLEGFARQLITDDMTRYAIGLTMLMLWCLYYYRPRMRRHG